MANVGQSELANHTPTVLLDSAMQGLGHLRSYLNLARTVRKDFSATDFGTKGKTLQISKRGALSANDKAANTATTKQTPSDSKVDVVLSKHKEVTLILEDVADAVAIPNVLQAYIQDAVAVIAEQVETDIAAEYANAGTSLAIGDYTNWAEAVTAARRTLVSNKVGAMAPMYGQFDEYAIEAMLNTAVISKANEFGSNRPTVEGAIDKLRGVNIFESQIVGVDTSTSPDTYYPMVYGPEALVLAVRPLRSTFSTGVDQVTVFDEEAGLSMRVTTGYDKDQLGSFVTVDMLYGVKTVRPEHLVSISHTLPGLDS